LIDAFERPARFAIAENGYLSADGAGASVVAVAVRDAHRAFVLHVSGTIYAD
jgi:hypothetical protein